MGEFANLVKSMSKEGEEGRKTSLLITYDLRGEGRDFKRVEAELKRLQARRILKSVWLYDDLIAPEMMLQHLLGFVEDRDGLFVATVGVVASHKLD